MNKLQIKRVGFIGSGNLAGELRYWAEQTGYIVAYKYNSFLNNFRKSLPHVIAVGYPRTKKQIINTIKTPIIWSEPIVHDSCIMGNNISIGQGSVICPLVILTNNVEIGSYATINTHVTIGHDVKIGDYVHTAPGVTISGHVTIGDSVFMGANSCIKEKISICDDVIIGAGAVVVKDIVKPGIYAGNPCRWLKDHE